MKKKKNENDAEQHQLGSEDVGSNPPNHPSLPPGTVRGDEVPEDEGEEEDGDEG